MKLGDLVYYITYYTGIRWVWKKINPNCDCDKRREEWNDIDLDLWKQNTENNGGSLKLMLKVSYQKNNISSCAYFIRSTINTNTQNPVAVTQDA